MSKRSRKVAFKDEVDFHEKRRREREEEEEDEDEAHSEERPTRFKAKHSLDSDEEDEKDEVRESRLGDEDLAAQEASTITFDDGIQVTPFNLKEEMEEGFFDAHGNYYAKKDEESVEDTWLQDVDWNKVEELREMKQGEKKGVKGEEGKEEDEDEEEDESKTEPDRLLVYQQILEILRPGETVLKAVKRLGGGKSTSASDRWKKKKQSNGMESRENAAVDKVTLENLTGLADQLVAVGDYTVYEDTYEKFAYRVKDEEKRREPVDMFSEMEGPSSSSASGATESGTSDLRGASAEVMWEFKWEDKEEADVHGPFSSTQMAEWAQSGYFADGVSVRKSSQSDAHFYSSKRIDFDLYT